ncbi:unnamed protein product [Cylicostephanus goldi]|uniref:Uncharacterized protein n=1 Tax=Cylicostephanus goldi TaxID=71465 RepID=A0A3P7ML93_CYLGO|nr:unnamed protein product [Cylicostephanus goldi]
MVRCGKGYQTHDPSQFSKKHTKAESGLRLKMADVMPCFIPDGEYFIVDEPRLMRPATATTDHETKRTDPQPTAPSSELDSTFGQFLRLMTDLIKKEVKKEDIKEADAKDVADEIFNLE